MKKTELKAEIRDLQEKLKASYAEILQLTILLKAGEILDDEEENPHADWDRSREDKIRLREKESCPINLERVAAAL